MPTIHVRCVDRENLNDGLGLRVPAYSRNSWWNFLNTYNFTFTHGGRWLAELGAMAIWAPHQELLILWMIIFLFWSLWFTAPNAPAHFDCVTIAYHQRLMLVYFRLKIWAETWTKIYSQWEMNSEKRPDGTNGLRPRLASLWKRNFTSNSTTRPHLCTGAAKVGH